MRNLNGTPTATEEGALALASLPLWFIGSNASATQAKASTKLLEQTGQVTKTSQSLGTGRTTVKQWLQNAENLERTQLIKDIEGAGFKKVFSGKSMMILSVVV